MFLKTCVAYNRFTDLQGARKGNLVSCSLAGVERAGNVLQTWHPLQLQVVNI